MVYIYIYFCRRWPYLCVSDSVPTSRPQNDAVSLCRAGRGQRKRCELRGQRSVAVLQLPLSLPSSTLMTLLSPACFALSRLYPRPSTRTFLFSSSKSFPPRPLLCRDTLTHRISTKPTPSPSLYGALLPIFPS